MGEEIRVCFFSADAGRAMVIGRALGPDFMVQQGAEFKLNGASGSGPGDVVLLDFNTAGSKEDMEVRLRLMDSISQSENPPPIIAMLGEDEHALLLRVIERGAYDAIAYPPAIVELRLILRRAHKFHQAEKELQQLRAQEHSAGRLHELIGASEPMQEVFALVRKIAPCNVNVLISGETGTGKELLARAIHRTGQRASRPFVAFSCVNLPETLLEDELFGHEKGAFTGALMSRRGRLEMADQGTLFLDEIGDISLGLQPKLLRVLQEYTFERLGSNTPVTVNLRLLCATNRNLEEMVRQGKFREDLYYRLNVVQVHLPPLRDRRDDIPFLAHHFLYRFAEQFGKNTKRFSRLALLALEEYPWPGNVRELENAVQRAVVLAEGQTIDVCHLPIGAQNGCGQSRAVSGGTYEEQVRAFRRRLVLRTLREYKWHKVESARALQVTRGYLHRLINQLDIREQEEADVQSNLPEQTTPPKQIM